MALVVLLRGVNVGGHRRFRPARLAEELRHLDAVNIGAAGTFVIHRAISPARLRAELARRLPFATEIVICQGRDILMLLDRDWFATHPAGRDTVRFLTVLAGPPRDRPTLPMVMPSSGEWLVHLLAREGRFVIGVYRRNMKAIGQLGAADRLFGVPTTTRNWNTVTQIARRLTGR